MDDTQAEAPRDRDTVEVTLGERTVRVPAGGLFDRYRMQADLDEVAKDPRVAGVDFFRSQPEVEVQPRIGPTSTPNFHYAMSNGRLTMIAAPVPSGGVSRQTSSRCRSRPVSAWCPSCSSAASFPRA